MIAGKSLIIRLFRSTSLREARRVSGAVLPVRVKYLDPLASGRLDGFRSCITCEGKIFRSTSLREARL